MVPAMVGVAGAFISVSTFGSAYGVACFRLIVLGCDCYAQSACWDCLPGDGAAVGSCLSIDRRGSAQSDCLVATFFFSDSCRL